MFIPITNYNDITEEFFKMMIIFGFILYFILKMFYIYTQYT